MSGRVQFQPDFIASSQATSAVRTYRRRRPLRRVGLILAAGVALITLGFALHRFYPGSRSFSTPSPASLVGLTVPQRIVAIAESQVGYSTQPSNTYCNKFSAYWDAGTANCAPGETAEEWCADFAAWAWHEAGVQFTYGYGPGEINGAAVSFYQWAVANGEWHPVSSTYVAAPGDVAVYGLSLGADPTTAHVAIVTHDPGAGAGPDVVNGDGDQTGFSVVETATDQRQVHNHQGDFTLDGYVSPP
jgi:hypothetical protein